MSVFPAYRIVSVKIVLEGGLERNLSLGVPLDLNAYIRLALHNTKFTRFSGGNGQARSDARPNFSNKSIPDGLAIGSPLGSTFLIQRYVERGGDTDVATFSSISIDFRIIDWFRRTLALSI